MITVVVGKEIEKIKGDFENYLNGLNMVGEISYSQYSELYDEGTKQIQKAYELGKSDLEKENAELQKEIRCECTRCVYSDSPCIRSDYGVENDEDVCPNYENVFTAYTQLKEENAELRKEWQEQVQKATDEGYARTLQTMQLSKAKEIIKNLMVYVPVDLKEYEEAEQFISEVEK